MVIPIVHKQCNLNVGLFATLYVWHWRHRWYVSLCNLENDKKTFATKIVFFHECVHNDAMPCVLDFFWHHSILLAAKPVRRNWYCNCGTQHCINIAFCHILSIKHAEVKRLFFGHTLHHCNWNNGVVSIQWVRLFQHFRVDADSSRFSQFLGNHGGRENVNNMFFPGHGGRGSRPGREKKSKWLN